MASLTMYSRKHRSQRRTAIASRENGVRPAPLS